MTPQEVFDTIVNHLRKQGSKSVLSEEQISELMLEKGACAYRSPDGKKCAAGIMIADEEYAPNMEGINISAILFRTECPPSLLDKLGKHLEIVSNLQLIHDRSDVVDWENQFQVLAANSGLTYTAPDATDSQAPTDTSG